MRQLLFVLLTSTFLATGCEVKVEDKKPDVVVKAKAPDIHVVTPQPPVKIEANK